MTLNAVMLAYFLVAGVGFGTWAALKNLVDNVKNLGLFASCYQCSSIVATNIIKG